MRTHGFLIVLNCRDLIGTAKRVLHLVQELLSFR
jgi:hypothetical protein